MPKVLGIKEGSLSSSQQQEDAGGLPTSRTKGSVVYYVLSDNLNQLKDDILNTAGVPGLFTFWNFAWVVGFDTKETHTVTHPITGAAAAIWEVTVNLDSDLDADANPGDPIALIPTTRWTGETEDEVLERDVITGDPVATDAGEPLLCVTPLVVPILEVTRYEFYPFDPDVILQFANRVNSATFYGAPPGTALMMTPEVDEESFGGLKFCKVTYRVKFKIKPGQTEPWKARLLHHGYKYKDEEDGDAIKVATDKHGNPITVNLENGTGHKLADTAAAQYKEFNRFGRTNFNILALGPF